MAHLSKNEKLTRNSTSTNTTENDDNVWSSILNEVRDNESLNSSKVMTPGKSIVVLGDSESGKTTLIAKLQGIEDPKKGCGLEYAHIEVRDEYRDESTQLNVWVLDGNPNHSNLLRFALPASQPFEKLAKNTIVVITVSMATPWTIVEQLQFWAGILNDYIDSLNLSPDEIQFLREQNLKRWVNYVEPGGACESQLKSALEEEEVEVKKNSILTRNLGLDVIVVVTKTDHVSILERENEYRDEHFDFIQFHVRKFCLQYGAGLVYTSVKEDKNCDLLYKYIVHRLYYPGNNNITPNTTSTTENNSSSSSSTTSAPLSSSNKNYQFRTPALIVEKDAVFIPSGWDNEKKIGILQENMTSFKPEEFFNDVILKPNNRNNNKVNLMVQQQDKSSSTSTSNSPSLSNSQVVAGIDASTNTSMLLENNPQNFPAAVQVEDEQKFLKRLLNQFVLNQNQNNQNSTNSPNSKFFKSNNDIKSPSPQQNSPLKKDSPAPPSSATGSPASSSSSERVLAHFFNSLLSKKGGGQSGDKRKSGTPGDKSFDQDDLINKNENKSLNSSDC